MFLPAVASGRTGISGLAHPRTHLSRIASMVALDTEEEHDLNSE